MTDVHFFWKTPFFLEKAIEPALVVITEARLVPFVLGDALPGFIFILHFVLVFVVVKLKTRLTDVAVLA